MIEKEAEYRVYVMFGRVASVARKVVEDTSQVAWNHAVGATFYNVRWGEWPLDVCQRALDAAALSGLDYAAVDVMVEERTATPWIIEINSAGSLPPNEDRTPSYRNQCVAKCLGWHLQRETYDHFEPVEEVANWRHAIHPAIWPNHEANRTDVPTFTSVRSSISPSDTIGTTVQ